MEEILREYSLWLHKQSAIHRSQAHLWLWGGVACFGFALSLMSLHWHTSNAPWMISSGIVAVMLGLYKLVHLPEQSLSREEVRLAFRMSQHRARIQFMHDDKIVSRAEFEAFLRHHPHGNGVVCVVQEGCPDWVKPVSNYSAVAGAYAQAKELMYCRDAVLYHSLVNEPAPEPFHTRVHPDFHSPMISVQEALAQHKFRMSNNE